PAAAGEDARRARPLAPPGDEPADGVPVAEVARLAERVHEVDVLEEEAEERLVAGLRHARHGEGGGGAGRRRRALGVRARRELLEDDERGAAGLGHAQPCDPLLRLLLRLDDEAAGPLAQRRLDGEGVALGRGDEVGHGDGLPGGRPVLVLGEEGDGGRDPLALGDERLEEVALGAGGVAGEAGVADGGLGGVEGLAAAGVLGAGGVAGGAGLLEGRLGGGLPRGGLGLGLGGLACAPCEGGQLGFEAGLFLLAEGAAVEEAVEGGGSLAVSGGAAGGGGGGAGGLGLGDGGVAAGGGLPFGGLRGGHGLIGVAEAGGGGGVLAGELVAAEGVGLGLALEAVERTAVG